MKKVFIVMNHKLTDEQIRELKEKYGVEEIVYMPEELAKKFGQVTPDTVSSTAREIVNWIDAEKDAYGDTYVVVQGHNALVMQIVLLLSTRWIKCLYAYSERVSLEEKLDDGTVTKKSCFKHRGFYEYHLPANTAVLRYVPLAESWRGAAGVKDGNAPAYGLVTAVGRNTITFVPNWFTPEMVAEGFGIDIEKAQELINYMDKGAVLAEEVSELFWRNAEEILSEWEKARCE